MKAALLAILLFSAIMFSSIIAESTAVEGQWITYYEVKDLSTDLPAKDTFEGLEYNITLRINVTTESPTCILKLCTNLEHSTLQDVYWKLLKDYPGINPSDWNPNQPCVEFNQKKGTLMITSYGKIPDDITKSPLNSEVILHEIVENYTVIELIDAGNYTLDKITFNVIDNEIKEYQNLLSDKEDVVTTMTERKIVSKYIELSEDIIGEAKKEANMGFVDEAKRLLNLVPSNVDDLPITPSQPFIEKVFIPVVGGLSAVIVIVGLLFVRSKGKLNYTLKVLEDQIKDLEGIVIKASRVEKSISTRLETIRDRLKNLVGV